ncbi:hypothetical protein NM208_g13484 [Fusarium decemcellulare]|uniref:Uncharacterized protein n=1 Tax=Fusarium decemcellulare TaxID=57161 RepID=A0ACC1RL17_9HYPO|nr:hypothetical protein NM208_g13484 [Fusarium decemcellulare]
MAPVHSIHTVLGPGLMKPPAHPAKHRNSAEIWTLTLQSLLGTSTQPGADIVFLQEVSKSALVHLLRDPRIRKSWYSSEANTASWGGHLFATMTLLSKARFGCFNDEILKATLGPVWRVKFPSRFDRDALCCDVYVSSPSSDNPSKPSRLRLVNVHLDSLAIQPSKRPEQLSIVADMLRDAGQGLVAGDFNPVLPEDSTLAENNGLVDAWVQVHGSMSGFTWGIDRKQRFPPGRLDKVAMLGLQPYRIEVMHPGVIQEAEGYTAPWSDHSGLKCTFGL